MPTKGTAVLVHADRLRDENGDLDKLTYAVTPPHDGHEHVVVFRSGDAAELWPAHYYGDELGGLPCGAAVVAVRLGLDEVAQVVKGTSTDEVLAAAGYVVTPDRTYALAEIEAELAQPTAG